VLTAVIWTACLLIGKLKYWIIVVRKVDSLYVFGHVGYKLLTAMLNLELRWMFVSLSWKGLSVSSGEISACQCVIVSCWGTGNGGVSAVCCFSVSAWPPVWLSFCSNDLLLSLMITHHITSLIDQGANWSVLISVNFFPYWHLNLYPVLNLGMPNSMMANCFLNLKEMLNEGNSACAGANA